MSKAYLEITKEYEIGKISYSEYIHKFKELYLIEKTKESNMLINFKRQNTELTCSCCLIDSESTIQLECGHYTHLKCLEKCQNYNNDLFFKCPTCRHEISDIHPKFNLENIDYIYYKKNDDKLNVIVVDHHGTHWNCPENINTPFITKIINSGKLYTSYDKKKRSFYHNPTFKKNLLSEFDSVADPKF